MQLAVGLAWIVLWAGEPVEANASAWQPVEVVDEEPLPEESLPGAGAIEPAAPPVIQNVESPKGYTGQADPALATDRAGPTAISDRVGGLDSIFGRSSQYRVEQGPDEKVHLRPFSEPLSVLGVVLEPIREANLLLPERLDPFADRSSESEPIAEEAVEDHEAYIARIKKQREMLGTSSFFPRDPNKFLDVGWHYQVQLGGSFRAGNNTAANVNTQGRAERHSLKSDFLARLQAFYTQVEDGIPNRRIFGELNNDRNLRGRWICYVREELEYDEARLINIRTVTSGGIGFRFIDSIYERLIARTGPTASYVDYASPAESEDEFRSGWLIEGDYRRVIGDASRFELTSTAFPDFDTQQAFRIRTEGAILFPIGRTSTWSWKIGVRHEYILNPVITTQPNDVEGYFSIVYTK